MVRAIFKDLVITAAGDFPSGCSREQVVKWVKMRKGEFSNHLDGETTHLLFTDEEFKSKNKPHRIKEAERRSKTKGAKKIRIVSWSWFTKSCRDNMKLAMREYKYDAMKIKEKKDAKAEIERARAAASAYRWIRPEMYSVAKDLTSFEYKVDLFRSSENEDGTLHEKYELYFFRSHSSRPHMYWFGAKLFHKKDNGKWVERGIERPSPCCSPFRKEYERFRKFFELKTKIRWADRVARAGTQEKTAFSYSPPTGGKPVGCRMVGSLYNKALRSNKKMLRRYAELFGDELPSDLQIEDACNDVLKDIVDEVCATSEMDAEDDNGVNEMTMAKMNLGPGKNETIDSDMEGHAETDALSDSGDMAQSPSEIEDIVMEGHVEGLETGR
ncbi:hypothetical protein HER10_EVM0010522 [Colletotrichum scovillei]|uniref:Brct domain-containing protein n=1 Tax=Colletotrichum scovillei TaxID=1209932 RepID=A0A9P7UGJ1_9PEZI|nr:uncharacterized protein HER10_EVM0010522 [Colletotrichum scovillei]KAF4783486.1 hypothetical protein HER10_EVM0010522 [Colletotrichum scovillei]KAG7051782.1 brct domain-containing protein [Colletotrichum scovillei]KAG7070817.1 brct domain-containing protein [Colletotrichum scovillei]KAG7079087.1 brct domain-containing protein [Colletotrichum scovillei]